MKHLGIFIIFLNLIIGVISYIVIQQKLKKFRYSFLPSLRNYTLFFNLMVFVALSYKYSLTNLYSDNFDNFNSDFFIVLALLIFSSQCGMTFFLCKTTIEIQGQNFSKHLRYTFYILGTVLAIGMIAGNVTYYYQTSYSFLYYLMEIWIFLWILIILISLTALIANKKKTQTLNKKQVKSKKLFGIILLISYLLYAFTEVNFYFLKIDLKNLEPIFMLTINLSLLIWLRFYFPLYSRDFITKKLTSSVERIVVDFNISKREKDIIEQLLKGKSNKEIENELFISYNTVKNHIYNIFQKLDISSRGQLVSLVRDYEMED